MFMLRSFLPVGKGAFSVEQFNDPNRVSIVYDCGSGSGIKFVKAEIKSCFNQNEKIDFAFISHLDYDHVNGLDFLLEYCDVKNVVFPYAGPDDAAALTVDFLCRVKNAHTGSFVYRLINNTVETVEKISPETSIIFVKSNGGDIPADCANPKVKFVNSGENILEQINYGRLAFKNSEWEFVAYNLKHNEKIQKFKDVLNSKSSQLSKETVGLTFVQKVQSMKDEKGRKAISETYKEFPNGLNGTSLVLFSGTKNHKIEQFAIPLLKPGSIGRESYKPSKLGYRYNGCLYLGDYNCSSSENWERLKSACGEYWDYLGCVQLPHHGYSEYFNNNFTGMFAFYVISAERKNREDRSVYKVIKELLLHDNYPFAVTEEKDSGATFLID